jgi:stage III sporulation protein AH
MKEFSLKDMMSSKIWVGVAVLVFACLFGFGFRYFVGLNISPPSTNPQVKEQPAPLKIPREYSPSDSLLDLKIERDRERSQEKERIEELLDKVGLTDDTRKQAEQELWRLTQTSSKEQELETLLKAKGFQESMVTIHPKIVTVVVAGQIDAGNAGSIGQMAANITGYGLDQVEVVEK